MSYRFKKNVKKEVKFKKERTSVLKRINKIMGVTDENKKIYLDKITEEEQKKMDYFRCISVYQ